uniref:Uncharacterized protein n=1 Tax=Timema douglasi TaxID=61478 RepID=A0A7R8VVH0_TIMDO|nr:unnamed protein product [Timema douglasi]
MRWFSEHWTVAGSDSRKHCQLLGRHVFRGEGGTVWFYKLQSSRNIVSSWEGTSSEGREFGLRQLDLSLLSQLWSLNQSIQEFRQLLQDQEDNAALSPPSPSSADEGEEFYSPVRYHAPPQLPPGLQQLAAVPEQYQLSSSSSQSSIEYGDV